MGVMLQLRGSTRQRFLLADGDLQKATMRRDGPQGRPEPYGSCDNLDFTSALHDDSSPEGIFLGHNTDTH